MKRNLLLLLFWGSVWGICEASIGCTLHLASVALPGLPGALMFPIGFFCMVRVRKDTGKTIAPFYIATIAAAIKLVDFLLPGHVTIYVVNPALAIVMEGLAVSGVYAVFRSPKRVADYTRVLGMGILWRALFASYLFVISLYELPAALVTSGAVTLLRFVLLESFFNSLIIYAGLWLAPKFPAHKPWKIGPAAAATAFLTAVGLQVIL